jgi:hypothetical protein
MTHDPLSNATKPCARCGVDCTSLPRVKDDKGRYFCRPCYDRALTQMASRIVDTAPAISHPTVEPEPDANASLGSGYALAIPERRTTLATKPCPSCNREIRQRDSVCPHCGYNVILGQEAQDARPTVTARFKDAKACCGSCGYCIENLGSLTCPECGSPNRIPHRRDWDREDSEAIARTQIIRPGIYLAIGVVGFALLAWMHHSLSDFVAYLILYAVGLPAVVIAFLLCSLLWLGFNDKLSILVWKLAGIMALTSVVLFGFGSVGFLPLTLAGVTFATLIRIELDVDQSDAWLVGLAALVAQFGSYFACVAIASRLGWI